MAFTIPDNDEATSTNQALWMQTDINAIAAGIGGDGVVGGCAVAAQGSPNMTVAVAAGVVRIGGSYVTVASGNVTITTANATNPRIDLIVVNNSGTKSATAGTAAANPKAPDIPANSVLLAMVYVPANDTTISSDQITDKRLLIPGVEPINVLSYGAIGDGTTDDTLAIRSAITAAGTNGTLLFPGNRTYLISGSLEPLAGQVWWGYGAKIKRRAEVTATTSTAIATGNASNVVTVASVGSLAVGMDVSVINGSTYEQAWHRISSIVGTTVTIDTAFTTAFPSGGTIVTTFALIWLHNTATDVRIFGFELDGNQANNTSIQKWAVSYGVACTSSTARLRLRDLYVHDSASEGIGLSGTDLVVESCHVLNSQGNGIHFSGTTNARVINNYVKNCNLAGTAPGHADGCIIASDTVGYTQIIGNYCENGIGGIASFDSDDNSTLVCSNNIVKSCTSYGFEGSLPSSTKVGKIVLTGNQFYSSVVVSLDCAGTSLLTTQGAYRVVVADNYLEDTTFSMVNSANDVTIENNVIAISATTGKALDVEQSANVKILGNLCIGADVGIYLAGTSSRDIDVAHNTCKNNTSYGINVAAAPAANVKLDGNTIVVESTFSAGGTYAGIAAANGVLVTNNTVDIGTNTSGQYGILCPAGGVSTAGATVTNNRVTTLSNVPSIRCPSSSQRNIVVGNGYLIAPSDAGSGNVLTQNYPLVGTYPALGLAYGGTNADLSATGGAGQVLKQTSAGGAVTVAAITAADIAGVMQTGMPQPSLNSGLTWSFDPAAASNTNQPTAGVVYLQKHYTPVAITVSNISIAVSTGGATLSNCYFGIYNASGTRLGLTADMSSSLTTSGVNVTGALTGSVSITAGSVFYTALLFNGTTTPTLNRGGAGVAVNIGIASAASGYRAWTSGTGQTALPSSITVSSGTVSSQSYLVVTS